MARHDFSATSGSPRLGRLALVGVIIVPLLIGGVLAWSLSAPLTNLDRVTAAIVNDDEPVTIEGQTVPLGREFAAGLMNGSAPTAATPSGSTPSPSGSGTATRTTPSPTPSATTDEATPDGSATPAARPTFDWVLTNADEAAAGLASGRYVAVVTIPPDFSATATSFSGAAADATQAEIRIATTPASAWLDPALSELIAQSATESLNRQLTERYLGQVYEGFNTINAQIADAADGAQQLVDGIDDLVSGIASLQEGADSLAAGLADLDDGVQTLPAQTSALAVGAEQVAAGVSDLAGRLGQATASFQNVVDRVCRIERAADLCDSANAALDQLRAADGQLDTLAAGANAVAAGDRALADSMPSLVAGVDSASAGGAELAEGAADLADGAEQVDDGANSLADGLESAVEQIPTYSSDDISRLSTVVAEPVLVDSAASVPGMQSAPFFAALALWSGGLVLALALQSVPTRRLLTGSVSSRIAWSAAGPAAAIGLAQGVVVSAAVLESVSATPAQGVAFVGASAFVGAVFALANIGLAAAFGGIGRVASVAILLVALAAGLSSTVPPAVSAAWERTPTAAASALLLSTLTGDAAAAGGAVIVLALTAVVSFGLTYAGVGLARRRAWRVSV